MTVATYAVLAQADAHHAARGRAVWADADAGRRLAALVEATARDMGVTAHGVEALRSSGLFASMRV